MKYSGFKIYLLIWLGTFISEIGTGMTSFALGIYIYQLTGQAASSALVTLCAFLPGLLMTPLAGILADRYDRRLLMALGDGLSGLGVLWIYFSLQTSQPSLLNICLGAAISSVFSALVNPAFRATIPTWFRRIRFPRQPVCHRSTALLVISFPLVSLD